MQNGSQKKLSLKQQKLQLAAHQLSSALSLFENPTDLSLSYKDLLKTVAHYPELVQALLAADIQELEEKKPITLMMDGYDLTLLGSQHESVMKSIIDNHAELLLGADLLKAAQMYPKLAEQIFSDKALCDKLSGRQLAELGALDPEIAKQIKASKPLWDRVTINAGVDELAAQYLAQKEAGEITELAYRLKIRHLESEDKTYMHVGILCQNNPELADELVDEGFLEKLNGEDLSYFVQYHPKLIDKVLDTKALSQHLDGNDFRRLGLGSEQAARTILASKDFMEKAGPHVWASLCAQYPFFFREFMTVYDQAVRKHVQAMTLHETNPALNPKPEKSELMRLTGEFLIEVAKIKGPKFAEYLYEQAVTHQNPVFRYVFELDGPHDLIDVDKVVQSIITQAKQQQGITKEAVQLQVGLATAGIHARNEQLKQRKDIYMTSLMGLSEKLGLDAIENLAQHPKQLKAMSPQGLRAICGSHARVALKLLDNEAMCDKLTSAQLTDLAGIHPVVLQKIWQNPKRQDQIIEHFALPRITGKSLPLLIEAAANRGYLDKIFASHKQKRAETEAAAKADDNPQESVPNDVPKGYTWYLYHVLYPRAEVVKTIQCVMKQVHKASASEEDDLQTATQLLAQHNLHKESHDVPETLQLSEGLAEALKAKLSQYA